MTAKKKPTNVNPNSNVNNNNINVNVHVPPSQNPNSEKEEKPNWIVKAIVLAAIGLIASIITIYVNHSTEANGKPAFIQGGTPAESK